MMMDIVEKRVEMKSYFSAEAKSLLTGLLEREPMKRLGSSNEDSNELKRHPWFKKINWEHLKNKEIEPPFKPQLKDAEDLRNIDKQFLNEPAKETPMGNNNLSPNTKEKNHFE